MSLRQTPLHDVHVALGARMVPFAGWSMPVQYQGIVAEHLACRKAMGLFDVSHMGELAVAGPGAVDFLQRAVTNDLAGLAPGRCRYALLCNPDGGVIDDLIVYRRGADDFLLVVNASNTATDLAWLSELPHPDAELRDVSAETALLAVQGPRSRDLLLRLCDDPERLAAMRYYQFGTFHLAGLELTVSRTGYTGDLGYELLLPAEQAVQAWTALLEAGGADGLVPVGLGARDTLRLEAGYPLHGHELSLERDPIAAGLVRFVDFGKSFIGDRALAPLAEHGTPERLVGLEVLERGIIRDGYPVLSDGEPVGVVTSGSYSPLLQKSIGLAYVKAERSEPDTELAVVVRDQPVPCRVVKPPFYRPA